LSTRPQGSAAESGTTVESFILESGTAAVAEGNARSIEVAESAPAA
jgi:hypothetical protein